MSTRLKALTAGTLAAVALVAYAAGSVAASAQTPSAAQTPTHEDMHGIMDAMHGEGASTRTHEAMGEGAEHLMDQCASMMNMMAGMGGGMMPGGMETPGR